MNHFVKYYRLAAQLAIFSIAMLFIAPIISKNLHSSSHTAAAMPAMEGLSSTQDDCAMMSPMPSSHPSVFDRKMLYDMACGYCQLLAHFPFLQWIVLLALAIVYCPLQTLAIPPRIIRPLIGFWSSSQARAPPSF